VIVPACRALRSFPGDNGCGRHITRLVADRRSPAAIKEVVHRQDVEGTTTDIMITNTKGLGGNEAFGQTGSAAP
jgi:hypothetical protein